MNEREIIKLCNETLAQEFELDLSRLTPQARFREDLELDSLDAVDMVVALEEAFNYKLRDNEALSRIKTVGDLHKFVLNLVKAQEKG
jgi:acyl carrier protein